MHKLYNYTNLFIRDIFRKLYGPFGLRGFSQASQDYILIITSGFREYILILRWKRSE